MLDSDLDNVAVMVKNYFDLDHFDRHVGTQEEPEFNRKSEVSHQEEF